MSPDAPLTARASVGPWPGKFAARLEDGLDAGFNEQYQWKHSYESKSHFYPGEEMLQHPLSQPTASVKIIR